MTGTPEARGQDEPVVRPDGTPDLVSSKLAERFDSLFDAMQEPGSQVGVDAAFRRGRPRIPDADGEVMPPSPGWLRSVEDVGEKSTVLTVDTAEGETRYLIPRGSLFDYRPDDHVPPEAS